MGDDESLVEPDTREARATASSAASLQIEDLVVGYGHVDVLHGVNLSLPAGRAVALLGPNGAGKSTLLRAVSGLLSVRRGSIRLDGNEIVRRRPHKIARDGVLHVPESREIFGGMTVWENLRVAFDNLGHGDEAESFERIYRLFPILRDRAGSLAGNLSGGQQQMLAIARGLLGRPRVLMLDEPSLGLAQIIIKEIYASLAALREEGLTVLLVEQNATLAVDFADYSYVMVNGRIALEGPRDEMLKNNDVVSHYLGAV